MITQSLRLPNDPSSGGTSYGPHNRLNITHKKLENLGAQGYRNATTIGILSDNVLLEIFDQCRKRDDKYNQAPFYVWKWHLLAHVCRRWRQMIFASPRRLDLQLRCTYQTPVRKNLNIWPAIPIILHYDCGIGSASEDDAIAALEHADRVCHIRLAIRRPLLGEVSTLMQQPFPALTGLSILGYVSALPDGFLGGSAPSLQQLDLFSVLYPALPMLLLSAINLVDLRLRNIPPTDYISPEAMVSYAAASPKLETLYIEFSALTSFPDLIISPPITRTVLPALRNLSFSGECKYLEDFVSRIDTPQLNSILVEHQCGDININFDVPQLPKFINRSESFKRSLSRHCKIIVDQDQDIITFCVGRTTSERWDPKPGISVCLGVGMDAQISHLTNILDFMSPILSDIVHCTIENVLFVPESQLWFEQLDRDIDWLQLLRQLSSLQTLFVSDNKGVISQALAHVDGRMITEILPALQLLCLEEEEEEEEEEEDQATSPVHKFLAVRRDSGHPVIFVETKEEFEEKLKSYP